MDREIYEGIVKTLKGIVPYEFGNTVDGNFDCDEYCDEFDKNVNVFNGMSKLVIDDKRLPYVIKIPFNGIFMTSYEDYDDESDEDSESKYHFVDLMRAPSMNDVSDYCMAETEIYADMKKRGFERLFAEVVITHDEVNSHHIYTQEKVKRADISSGNSASIDSLNSAESLSDEYSNPFSNFWLASAIECYSYETVEAFIKYLEEEDPDWAHDFHTGNYGYRESDGTPCIMDYAGWND